MLIIATKGSDNGKWVVMVVVVERSMKMTNKRQAEHMYDLWKGKKWLHLQKKQNQTKRSESLVTYVRNCWEKVVEVLHKSHMQEIESDRQHIQHKQ